MKILELDILEGKKVSVAVDDADCARLTRYMEESKNAFFHLDDARVEIELLRRSGEHPGEELSRSSMADAIGMLR